MDVFSEETEKRSCEKANWMKGTDPQRHGERWKWREMLLPARFLKRIRRAESLSILLWARAGAPGPCVLQAAWTVLGFSAAMAPTEDRSKEWKQKITQPTCWNMAGYHWLEWNFTSAEVYSSHGTIFGKINMSVCLYPECKLIELDKMRESKCK